MPGLASDSDLASIGFPVLGGVGTPGMKPVRLFGISANLVPGGGSVSANVDPMWIDPGYQRLPPGLVPDDPLPPGMSGLAGSHVGWGGPGGDSGGLGGLAGYVPGSRGMGEQPNFNTSSTSTASSSATGGSAVVNVQGGGGLLSGESAPYALAAGGLGLLGLILWKALSR